MKITVNNVDISSRITSRKILSVIDENSPLLGNAVSKQLLLDVDNEDEFFNDLLNRAFIITESNQNGIFYVYDKPEKYTKQLSLKLYDSMFVFSQRYDTQQSYPTTIENQLDEMSGLTNVEIDKSNVPIEILTKEVNWYDNTISMRNYLGWIAELCGMNAFSNPQGVIFFKPLVEKTYRTIDVEDYSKSEKVKITRVCFDDGLVKFEQGTTEGNTLYLSPNNSYIDNQDIVDTIFRKYNGVEFYSINTVKMASIDGLEITELINYNDEFLFMPLSIEDVYKGGTYAILNVSGNIDTKNKETVINRIDQSVRIRRIKTIVDQNNQSLEIIAKHQEGLDKKVSQFEIDLNGIKQSVEDSTTEIVNISKSLYTLTIFGNGNVIKDANDTITLNASLFYKGVDVTEKKDASLFNWKRTSDNPTEDTAWNNAHKGKKSITIGANDVNKFASFSLECDVLVDVITASYMTIIDETDVPKLSLLLDANMPIQQIETNGQLWPQWNPLIITPDIKNGVLQIMLNDPNLIVSFKRIVDGVETDLLSSKEIVENKCLKVTENVLSSIVKRNIIYKCYATYKGFPINAQLSFALIKDGQTGEQGRPGNDGKDGKNGNDGSDGKTYYQWIVYATDSNGSNLSTDPTNKTYMGIAYQKETPTPSNNPRDYTWVKIQGPQGPAGQQGAPGLNGLQGPQGDQGIQGPPGQNGATSYFHIKYSTVAKPTTAAQMTETPSKYIGTYVDFIAADSTDPTKYTWQQLEGSQGPQGDQGIPGTNGTNGQTSYLHIAYATSSDGKTGFSTSTSTGKTYIGQYTDFISADSTDSTKYSWTLIKGDKGDTGPTGPQGIPGVPGKDGISSYFHIRFSQNANGNPMTESPSGAIYIGTCSSTSPTSPTSYTAYKWTKIKGEDGKDGVNGKDGQQGIPGVPGTDGKTQYLHIKYSDNGTSFTANSGETPGKYMGTYVDFTETDSTTFSKYTWAKVEGEDGKDAAIKSDIEPSDTTQLWCDTSVIPNQLKYYDSTKGQWELLNDNSDEIEDSKTELRLDLATAIKEEADRIDASVNSILSQIGDLNTLVKSVQNQMILTSDYTEFVRTTTQKLEDLVNDKLDSNQILEWARFDGSTLELGASNSNFMAKLSTNELGFYNNNVKVAYFSNNYLVVEKGIKIGSFGVTLEENGSLSIG